jgi:hypothetical protein
MAIETSFSGSGQLGEVKARDRGILPEPAIPQ